MLCVSMRISALRFELKVKTLKLLLLMLHTIVPKQEHLQVHSIYEITLIKLAKLLSLLQKTQQFAMLQSVLR